MSFNFRFTNVDFKFNLLQAFLTTFRYFYVASLKWIGILLRVNMQLSVVYGILTSASNLTLDAHWLNGTDLNINSPIYTTATTACSDVQIVVSHEDNRPTTLAPGNKIKFSFERNYS